MKRTDTPMSGADRVSVAYRPTSATIQHGCNNGKDILYHHNANFMVGIVGRAARAGCRPKSVMFLLCVSVFCHALELRIL